MRITKVTVVAVIASMVIGHQPAWAQWVITDPSTTARNTVTAILKSSLLQTLNLERERLQKMSKRLSVLTPLRKYVLGDIPLWRTHAWDTDTFPYAADYMAALTYGDSGGRGYLGVARHRLPADAVLAQAAAGARDTMSRALATLDAADSMLMAATHQTGMLRLNGRRELAAIDALERHVVDPSEEQSMTAVLDKISGAVLIETRQEQTRVQLLAAVAEQLIVENKRSRDAETAALNMQLGRLRGGRVANSSLLSGASADLRTWRQP